jgi:hypothetical protein
MLFINDKYDPNATLDDFTMNAKVHPLFWTDYYCRYSLLQDATDVNDKYEFEKKERENASF